MSKRGWFYIGAVMLLVLFYVVMGDTIVEHLKL